MPYLFFLFGSIKLQFSTKNGKLSNKVTVIAAEGAGSKEDELFLVLVEFSDASSPFSSLVGGESLRSRFVRIIVGVYHKALQSLRSQNFLLF